MSAIERLELWRADKNLTVSITFGKKFWLVVFVFPDKSVVTSRADTLEDAINQAIVKANQ